MNGNASVSRAIGVALASVYFSYCVLTPSDWHFIDGVDLIFHEAGHALFMLFGEFVTVLMGSGFQVLLPLAIAAYFFYMRQRISGAICLMWAGQSLVNVSVYARDALAMQLPLLGGESSGHDWNYLLGSLRLLNHAPEVSGAIYALGALLVVVGIALSFLYARR